MNKNITNQKNKETLPILLTGASGFIGQALVKKLAACKNLRIRITTRRENNLYPELNIECLSLKEISAQTDWNQALQGVKVVIHAAARAHIMKDKAANPLEEFRKVNREGTLNLARQAANAGVKRFIFISTVKVNGETTPKTQKFSAMDPPNPSDPYAISKYEAEQGLQLIAAKTGMEVVIIRPPLVYGSGVKGNFHRMLFWLQKGIILPLGAISNKRSLVSLGNLISLIETCIVHPKAANQIFLVSDGEDLSTTELLKRIGQALNKPACLLPIPPILLFWGAVVLGKKTVFNRLCGSLQVDMDRTKELLDWKPQLTVDQGLAEMVSSSSCAL